MSRTRCGAQRCAAEPGPKLQGWTPVVQSASANLGVLVAYIECLDCPFGDFNVTGGSQSKELVVGQFTVDVTGGAIRLTPSSGTTADYHIVNNLAATMRLRLRCTGGNVVGACFFNFLTFPTTDPLF